MPEHNLQFLDAGAPNKARYRQLAAIDADCPSFAGMVYADYVIN